jgi:DHA1 family tetracycline resistance protein-like MFS transporter
MEEAPVQRAPLTSRINRYFFLPRDAWVLTSTSSLWSIGSAAANPFQYLYFLELGASPLDIGFYVAFGTAVTIIALLVGGYIADTWGRRRVIIIFSWISVASAFAYYAINSASLIIIPLSLASISSVYTPAFNSVMMDSIEPSDRIRGFSVFNAINTIPSGFVPTAGGILMSQFGILEGVRIAYLLSAGCGVVAVSIRSLALRETYPSHPSSHGSIFSYVKESFVAGLRSTVRADPVVKKLLVYVTLAGIGTGLTSPFAAVYVVSHLNVDPLDYSIVVDLAGLTTVVLLLGVIFLIQKLGAKKSVLVASVAAPVSNVMFSQAKTMDELLEWGVTGAVATALQTPSLATMQAETIPASERGKILAMFSVLPSLVSLPSQVAAGYLYSSWPVAPFVASTVPFGFAALVLYSIRSGNSDGSD